jgi:hypothetical protein
MPRLTEIPVDPHTLARVLDSVPDTAEPVTNAYEHAHGPAELVTVMHAVRIHGRSHRIPLQRITSALPPHVTGRYGRTITTTTTHNTQGA